VSIFSVNPANRESVGNVECTPVDQVNGIVRDARYALTEWQSVSFRSRSEILNRFSDVLLSRRQRLAEIITRENGKPLVEAYTSEIVPALDLIKYYTRKTPRLLRDRRVSIGIPLMKTKKSFVHMEPYGVVAIISPWNYPLLLPLGQIVPALLTGNAVVFKPSEFTPVVGDFIAQLLWEAGVPRKVFNIVQGLGDVGAALVASGVDKIFFTGSTATGRKVSELAARNLTPVSLELGSKDAMIILDDANIEIAASAATWGAFMNAGQTCVSTERCFVHKKIFDPFLESLRQKAGRLRVGNGMKPDIDVGPIIHRKQFDIIRMQVDEVVSRGAKVVSGGKFTDTDGAYFAFPTIVTGAPMDSRLMNEETFGPVLPVVPFESDDEAVELANASKFGLSASIWTADRKRGIQIARRVKAGAVTVNDVIGYYGISDGVVGGVKESGAGRVHGRDGLREMVYPKYFEVERAAGMKKLWWYNYNQDVLSFFETATEFLFTKSFIHKMLSLFKLGPNFLRIKKL